MSFSPSNHRGSIRISRISLAFAIFCLLDTATAQTEIHRCTDADGSIIFSQLPCAPEESVEPEVSAAAEKVEAETADSAMPEQLMNENPEQTAESDADRAACQKPIRDAIDAIDAEIGREYTPEKADQYKQRLLELTRKLRQC